jgi:hypothetical protein
MSIELAECSRIFEGLESERAALLAELREWPEERLKFRPAAGAWSAVEVLDHVVGSEAGTIDDVRAGLRHPHTLGDEERPGIATLDRALRSDRSFKVPAGGIFPDAQTTLDDVAGRWAAARAELRALVEGMAPEDACGGVFEHPFAGWMTVGDVLNHFGAHLYHHQYQLARLRVGSAKGS